MLASPILPSATRYLPMLSTVRSLAALLCAAALLLAGGGLQTTLLALRATIEGFPTWLVGMLFSAYSVGFMAGCIYVPRLLRAVGHIRVFAALAAITAAAAVVYMLVIGPVSWMFLRAINGFCFAGLSMVIESWLNERAENQSRGRLLGIYRMVDLGSTTVGQLLLAAGNPAHHELFSLISVLISLAVVPVALTRSAVPAPVVEIKLDLRRLYHVSPLAIVATFGVGLSNGAFWALAPVFVRAQGLSPQNVAWFMTAAVIAGACAQFPVGWLSDRIDRRTTLVGFVMLASLASLFLAYSHGDAGMRLFVGAALFGATAMPIYGLAIAHANDAAQRGEFVRVSSGLLLGYSSGAVIGPIIAGWLMMLLGAQALFVHTALVEAALVLFGLYRMTRRPARPAVGRPEFISLPPTSPQVYSLDPRAGELGEERPSPQSTKNSAA